MTQSISNVSTILLALLIAMGASVVATGETPAAELPDPSRLHVYLLIGQSNMVGRAAVPSDAPGAMPHCLLLDDDEQWVPATNSLNRFSSIRRIVEPPTLGPGWSFAMKMLARNPGITLGLVANATGGTPIRKWQKGERDYEEIVRRARAAMKTGTLKGVLWHQGEADVDNKNYLRDFGAFIANLRADLDAPQLPIVVGQIRRDDRTKNINRQIAQTPSVVHNSAAVMSHGLGLMDGVHFDTAAVLELGRRYAEKMRGLQRALGEE